MFRMPFCQMAVLAVFSLATASAQGGASTCHPTPQESRRAVPWAGNTGDISWSADPPDCKVDASGPSWISVSVLPPVSGESGKRVLRYSVDTNFTPSKREGKIQIGDAAVTIEQAPGPAPGIAFSPNRLEFTITPGKDSITEQTKMLFVGSEEPLVITASAPDKTATWLQIKKGEEAARRQRSFEIVVSAAGREPGVYQTDIVIEAPGAANAKEFVPVKLTVGK